MNTLNPYRRVAAAIRQDIVNGVLRVGDALQGRPQLARRYIETEATITQALDRLVSQGVLETRQDGGVFVAALPPVPVFEPVDIGSAAVFECTACWSLVRRDRLSGHCEWHHQLED